MRAQTPNWDRLFRESVPPLNVIRRPLKTVSGELPIGAPAPVGLTARRAKLLCQQGRLGLAETATEAPKTPKKGRPNG